MIILIEEVLERRRHHLIAIMGFSEDVVPSVLSFVAWSMLYSLLMFLCRETVDLTSRMVAFVHAMVILVCLLSSFL